MTEKYILNEHIIPDGIMHDQELNNISFVTFSRSVFRSMNSSTSG